MSDLTLTTNNELPTAETTPEPQAETQTEAVKMPQEKSGVDSAATLKSINEVRLNVLGAQMTESVRKQEKLLSKTLWHSRIRTVITLLLCAVLVFAVVRVLAFVRNLDGVVYQASTTITLLSDTVEALDLQKTLTGIDGLVSEGTNLIVGANDLVGEGATMLADSTEQITGVMSSAQQTLDGLSGIDFQALNDSIKKLQTITEAFGGFFGIR